MGKRNERRRCDANPVAGVFQNASVNQSGMTPLLLLVGPGPPSNTKSLVAFPTGFKRWVPLLSTASPLLYPPLRRCGNN